MRPRKHHLTAMAAVVLLGGATALAQPALSVYGPVRRNARAANRQWNAPLYAAINGPSVGVFGAVAIPRVVRTGDLVPESRAPAAPVAIAQAADGVANRKGPEHPAATADRANPSAALQMTDTIRTISSASVPAREAVVSEVNARLAASEDAMAALSARARGFRGDIQAAFKAAAKDAHARAKALQRSIKAADRAKAEDWREARADLAAHYGAYAEAVAHAEAVASWSDLAGPTAGPPDDIEPLAGADGSARGQAAVVVDR